MINLIFWSTIIMMLFVIRDEWKSTNRNYIILTLELIMEIGLIYVALTI